jgi:HK97 gp10 family phage protein
VTFTLHVDLEGLDALLQELGDEADNAARPAAQAAAQVLYDEVKRNVAAIPEKTGNLARSIYQVYSEDHSGPTSATYHISWNTRKAPHGHLVEFGHIQRYASYIGKDGQWHTAIRPGMRDKPKPKRRASQAEKDAYYVTLPAPKQIAGRAFLRNAFTAKKDAATKAAEKVLVDALSRRGAPSE